MVDNAQNIDPWHACWISNISLDGGFLFVAVAVAVSFFFRPFEMVNYKEITFLYENVRLQVDFSVYFFDNEMEELSHLAERFMIASVCVTVTLWLRN